MIRLWRFLTSQIFIIKTFLVSTFYSHLSIEENSTQSTMYVCRPLQLLEIGYNDDEDEEEQHENNPIPRSGHRISVNKNGVFVFGGYNPVPSHTIFGELWQFNLWRYEWDLLLDSAYEKMPTELASMAIWGSDSSSFFVNISSFFANYSVDR